LEHFLEGVAPLSHSSSTTASCPVSAAQYKAVRPPASFWFASVPASSSRRTEIASPSRQTLAKNARDSFVTKPRGRMAGLGCDFGLGLGLAFAPIVATG
jgi:hypothetical protein